VPADQVLTTGSLISEPEEVPEKEDSVFIGWYSDLGYKINFKTQTATRDMTVYARYKFWWKAPARYVVINDYDWAYDEARVAQYFGGYIPGTKTAVGEGVLIYIFQRSMDVFIETVNRHIAEAEKYNVPLLFQLDPITFWDSVPELWNWWDSGASGYKDSNRENVEWYNWGSENAVKIGWLNWGSQIRLKPMANLFSPEYQAAVKDRMQTFLSTIKKWYDSLPSDKKYLLIGVKITGELGMGVNNWYYTGGNDMYDKDASLDPKTGIDMNNKPSRSNGDVSTIGYASATYSGVRTSGALSGDDIAAVEAKFTQFVSDIADDYFPRELIFAHAGGVGNDLDACMNGKVSPSWSFYGAGAKDVKTESYCMNLVKQTTAKYWGVAEWAIDSKNESDWSDAIRNAFDVEGCRFLSCYCNVIANNNGKDINMPAVNGIRAVLLDE